MTLWRRIVIRATDFPIDRKFAHLIRHRCFAKVESLRIEGYLQRFHGKPKATHPVLTRALLELLAEKTTNLHELIVADSSLENVNLNQFPQSLEILGFPGSIFAMQFLNPLPARFPNLTNLDVSDSISISSRSAGTMDAIFRLKTLRAVFIFKFTLDNNRSIDCLMIYNLKYQLCNIKFYGFSKKN